MPISYSQPYELVCPTCQTPFVAEAWLIVDAEERPDLVQAIRDVTLHDTRCPSCGQTGVVPAPVLLHDRRARAVLFGVPYEMPEAEWNELAQGLLWMLIGALPREDQLPYLGNVQAEAGVAGVAEALDQLNYTPQSAAEAIGDALGSDDSDDLPPLAEAIMRMLAADTPEELQAVLHEYPFLLDEAMDEGLAGLAEAAVDAGEFEISQAFERARISLTQLRQTLDQSSQSHANPKPTATVVQASAPPPANWNTIRRAVLACEDASDLAALRAEYPILASADADVWLAEDQQALRDVGDLGGAQLIGEARAVLRGER
ncbi:CpXC domain-containing protein [Herpetosiphon sp. NSE202]|uniref:CpXC domain-containing protein n=1 Tax=Herpetosiphon sp. NSE202 TaxID=3351349 RepID=UPI0036287049